MYRNRRSAGKDCKWSAPRRRLRIEPLEDRRLLAITVDTLLDVVDAGDGVTSLREAITTANTTSEDKIDFAVTGEIDLLLGELQITDTLTITGPGRELLTIDAQLQSRVINFRSNDASDLSLVGLAVTRGQTPLAGGGGGILFSSTGNLTVVNSVISNSVTTGAKGYGGGILVSGNLTLVSSTVTGNKTLGSFGFGGGIYSAYGKVNVQSSTISDNVTLGNYASGGGISARVGAVSLHNSTLSNNYTMGEQADGGGLHTSSATISESTISENSTARMGGGILLTNSISGSFEITNSIVAGNEAFADNSTSDIAVLPENSFVANYSLFGNDVVPGSGFGNRFTVNPLLAPLANNGGPTQTHALLPGSPALDAGSAMFVNVAREGVATQSSDFDGEFLANRAIDGNTATPTHTLIDDSNPHWQVELAAEHTISEIVLHNRDDCCQSRLRDITVQILDNFDNVVFTSELLNPENVLGGSMVNVGPTSLHLDLVELTGAAVLGRKVRVTRTPDPDFSGSGGVGPVGEENVLSLGEVEIFAVDQRGRPRVVDGGSGLRQDIGAYEAQTPPTLLLGDADNNFVVEGGDLLAVTNNFGSTGQANGLLLGDANDDGNVDGGDLLAVTNNFGSTAGQTAAAIVRDEASDEAFAVYPEVTIAVKRQAVRLAEASGSLSTNAARDELLLLAAESVVSQRDDGFIETDLNEEESEDAAAETIFEVLSLV